ncbi:uncharacterized protein AMSG_08583 [Thecamonas trahens ATCC 50062]|uniref:Uncharacterized protein n=1 Tax=Thecamonas trahens ATCC 50062 TaxID=461836 RepID=A0A0L0DKG7_THETB|nr:hypothetical protein AMSG_08583 [Thecamonas trahens ATCC 50062]KNC52705.1 hypothetical protein AMSG_08583 [Thecamonas trahens ATCC 50062]|eukprot:XP_013755025.1 hypothetical protein AMSG_08583 [Thecamonas trahens ATCC 50062]
MALALVILLAGIIGHYVEAHLAHHTLPACRYLYSSYDQLLAVYIPMVYIGGIVVAAHHGHGGRGHVGGGGGGHSHGGQELSEEMLHQLQHQLQMQMQMQMQVQMQDQGQDQGLGHGVNGASPLLFQMPLAALPANEPRV